MLRKMAEYVLAFGDPILARDWITKGVNDRLIDPLMNMDTPEGKILLREARE